MIKKSENDVKMTAINFEISDPLLAGNYTAFEINNPLFAGNYIICLLLPCSCAQILRNMNKFFFDSFLAGMYAVCSIRGIVPVVRENTGRPPFRFVL